MAYLCEHTGKESTLIRMEMVHMQKDRGDHTGQLCIDLQGPFALRGKMVPQHDNKVSPTANRATRSCRRSVQGFRFFPVTPLQLTSISHSPEANAAICHLCMVDNYVRCSSCNFIENRYYDLASVFWCRKTGAARRRNNHRAI